VQANKQHFFFFKILNFYFYLFGPFERKVQKTNYVGRRTMAVCVCVGLFVDKFPPVKKSDTAEALVFE
jgi:hypothetical protein